MKIFASVLVFLVITSPVVGQIDLTILDYPSQFYSYQPVYVTYEIRNVGAMHEVIPISNCRSSGTFLEMRRGGDENWSVASVSTSTTYCHDLPIPFPADDRHFVQRQTSTGLVEGRYEIRAVLRSDGVCVSDRGRAEELGTDPILSATGYLQPFSGQQYRCWEGTVRSEPVIVDVLVPQGEQDEAVREWLGDPPRDLSAHWREMVERFPKSQYTYAVHFLGGSPASMQEAIQLQPENPLNRNILGYLAQRALWSSTPCADDVAPLTMPISELPVPEPVKAWLEQEKQRMTELCPRILEQRRQVEESREKRSTEGYDRPD